MKDVARDVWRYWDKGFVNSVNSWGLHFVDP